MGIQKEKDIHPLSLVGHIENKAKVIPFPTHLTQNQKKQRSMILRKRVYSFCVDIYTIVAIKILMTMTYGHFIRTFFFQLPYKMQQKLMTQITLMDFAMAPIVFISYFLISYYMADGKTVGKLLFKLSVAKNNLGADHLPSFKESLLRTLGYVICYLSAGVLFAVPFLRKDRRGIPDMISGTRVYSDLEIYNHLLEISTSENVIQIDFSKLPTEEKKVA